MDYLPRTVDAELDELIVELPAIALQGPRGVGKTTTASRRAARVLRLDDEATLELAAADPGLVAQAPEPLLLDEWQRYPQVWDRVRRAVDDGAPAGRYLLTGSATPAQAPAHTGAGRIVTVRMRPLSLAERGLAGESSVSLGDLLRGGQRHIAGDSDVMPADYLEEVVGSGFPSIRRRSGRAQRAQLQGYLDQVVEHEFAEQGLRVRRPGTLRAWLAAYAAATATTTSYNAILDAATPGLSDKPAKTTTIAYRDILEQLWLLDPLPAWLPGSNPLERLTRAPKHHLADPALAAQLLDVSVDELRVGQGRALGRGSLAGHLFESLVTMSVRTYAQANEATVHHLRTERGAQEVDLVVEGRDGKVVALEIKLSASVTARDVRHLLWLREQLGAANIETAVITTGPHAYRRSDGVAVIPAALLGP